jgi:AcrR family transcriptional regulator
MNESKAKRRAYRSAARTEAAGETRARILASAKDLFGQHGIDAVTIAEIADKSGVAGSTVYAVFKSKEGILRELMEQSLFGDRFQSARQSLAGIKDPVEAIARTSHVARAIYESESSDLGLLRNVSGFSPALRKIEEEFEATRLAMQEDRLRRLFKAGKAKRGISLDEARRILWMYTSRDVYRMLVVEGGWTPDRYEAWLEQTLVAALVEGEESGKRSTPKATPARRRPINVRAPAKRP